MIIGISSFAGNVLMKLRRQKEDYEQLKKKLNSDVDFEVELNDENLYEFIVLKTSFIN
jgi:hypothetical protein